MSATPAADGNAKDTTEMSAASRPAAAGPAIAKAQGADPAEANRANADHGAPAPTAPAAGQRVGTVRGRVVASDTNLPIAGAKIFSERSNNRFGFIFRMNAGAPKAEEPIAVSGPDGQFTIANVAAKNQDLRFEAAGRRRQRYALTGLRKGEERGIGDVAMDLGAAAEGRVTDPAGAPVANAFVIARRAPQGRRRRLRLLVGSTLEIETTTDSSGRYKLDGLPPDEGAVVSAIAEGRIPSTSANFVPRIGTPTIVGDIVPARRQGSDRKGGGPVGRRDRAGLREFLPDGKPNDGRGFHARGARPARHHHR